MSTTFRVPRHQTSLVGESWLGKGPTVILLHAGVADRRSWEAVALDLSKQARVVSYDRRGFGETIPGVDPYTHVDDLIALLDHQHIETTWLVGSSGGGKLALEAAIKIPHRIDGLVLISPAVSGAPPPSTDDMDPELIEIDRLITREEELEHLDEVNRLEVRLWLDGPRELEGRVHGAPRELMRQMNAIALANFVAEGPEGDVDTWAYLTGLTIPTTVACGSFDAKHIILRSQGLATRIPHAKYVALEGMAHLPYLEDPLKVAALISAAIENRAPVSL